MLCRDLGCWYKIGGEQLMHASFQGIGEGRFFRNVGLVMRQGFGIGVCTRARIGMLRLVSVWWKGCFSGEI